MEVEDEALVLLARPHGENGAILSFLGFGKGLLKAYVPGARGKSQRATLQPGNRVALRLRRRTPEALGSARVELVESRALLAFTPGPALLLEWLTMLTANTLAERVPEPRLAGALDALLAGLAAGLDGTAAALAMARYECLLLEETGFGLSLDRCALGGPADALAYVSPKSGRAVSRPKATPWESKLLPLPKALGGAFPLADEAAAALALTGHFLARHFDKPELSLLRARTVHQLLAPLSKPVASA